MAHRIPFHRFALVSVIALVAGSCGGVDDATSGDSAGDRDGMTTTAPEGDAPGDMVVHPASYDLAAGIDQRFIAGASFSDGNLLAFGTVDFEFLYLGTREEPLDDPRPGPKATAGFLPIPGADLPNEGGAGNRGDPQRLEPSDVRGVYGADGVRFDAFGFWRVVVTAEVDGETLTADAAFGVSGARQTPAPGDPAPEADPPLVGAEGVDPKAIDSRAHDGEVPDPELHDTTVTAAVAAGMPVLVVVSTPVYCVSRFCGPITDAVADLASTYGDRAEFVHIEVWEDFEQKKVNAAARPWMSKDPTTQNLTEPWVFLVGADGVITHRWDNVATVADMTAALEAL